MTGGAYGRVRRREARRRDSRQADAMAETDRVRVGVLAPMKSELRSVVKAFALKPGSRNGVSVHTGTVGNADVVATTTGMGTALATRATERLLGLGEFDRVIVVGIAGGVGPSVDIGDVVIPEVVVDGTTGLEYRPAPIDAPAPRGTIVTSDDFVVDPNRLDALIADGVIAVDMETGSVAAACAARGVPWSAVRAISDRAEDGDAEMPGLAHSDGTPNGSAILKYFVRHPGRIPYMLKVGRGSVLAAKNAATTAARACARL
jgi:adenosylhomocysteine nucleosidase